MDSFDALKLLDDVADCLAASQGRQRRYRADQFLTLMHSRGWRMVRGVPVPIEPDAPEDVEDIKPATHAVAAGALNLAGAEPAA